MTPLSQGCQGEEKILYNVTNVLAYHCKIKEKIYKFYKVE